MFNYKANDSDLSIAIEKCLFCGRKIKDDEIAYEDYFVLFRGHSINAFVGCICFSCFKNSKKL